MSEHQLKWCSATSAGISVLYKENIDNIENEKRNKKLKLLE